MPTNLYLIRHADPLRDTGIEYRTLPGPDLSEHGQAEARQAAVFLATCRIEHLFASPFARASQTATAIAAALELPITFTPLIAEHTLGETIPQLGQRITEFLHSIAAAPYTRIAAVTHGSPIREMLLLLTQGQVDLRGHVYGQGNPAPTAGIWHLHHADNLWRAELVFKPVASYAIL